MIKALRGSSTGASDPPAEILLQLALLEAANSVEQRKSGPFLLALLDLDATAAIRLPTRCRDELTAYVGQSQ